MKLEEVWADAEKLDGPQRAELAERLLASLDDDEPGEDADVEEAWLAETRRRVAEIDRGEAELVDGPAALAQLRAELADRRR